MCEFCTEHGEGKKWYLQMKNYTDEMLHQELTPVQKETVNAKTRLEWNHRFWRGFIKPAFSGKTDIPISEVFTAKTPAGDKIEHFGQILPIEDVEQVIDMVNSITRMPCGCRYLSTGKTDKRYCFGIGIDKWGILGTFPDSASSLERLSKQEARKIIHSYDVEGLVHSIWTGVTPYVIGLCNCDHDCLAYRGYVERGGQPSFFQAEYICRVNIELCNGCKACMSQCQFGAQFYSSALSRVYISPEKCFGCGVCRAACPTNAIELVPRVTNSTVRI